MLHRSFLNLFLTQKLQEHPEVLFKKLVDQCVSPFLNKDLTQISFSDISIKDKNPSYLIDHELQSFCILSAFSMTSKCKVENVTFFCQNIVTFHETIDKFIQENGSDSIFTINQIFRDIWDGETFPNELSWAIHDSFYHHYAGHDGLYYGQDVISCQDDFVSICWFHTLYYSFKKYVVEHKDAGINKSYLNIEGLLNKLFDLLNGAKTFESVIYQDPPELFTYKKALTTDLNKALEPSENTDQKKTKVNSVANFRFFQEQEPSEEDVANLRNKIGADKFQKICLSKEQLSQEQAKIKDERMLEIEQSKAMLHDACASLNFNTIAKEIEALLSLFQIQPSERFLCLAQEEQQKAYTNFLAEKQKAQQCYADYYHSFDNRGSSSTSVYVVSLRLNPSDCNETVAVLNKTASVLIKARTFIYNCYANTLNLYPDLLTNIIRYAKDSYNKFNKNSLAVFGIQPNYIKHRKQFAFHMGHLSCLFVLKYILGNVPETYTDAFLNRSLELINTCRKTLTISNYYVETMQEDDSTFMQRQQNFVVITECIYQCLFSITVLKDSPSCSQVSQAFFNIKNAVLDLTAQCTLLNDAVLDSLAKIEKQEIPQNKDTVLTLITSIMDSLSVGLIESFQTIYANNFAPKPVLLREFIQEEEARSPVAKAKADKCREKIKKAEKTRLARKEKTKANKVTYVSKKKDSKQTAKTLNQDTLEALIKDYAQELVVINNLNNTSETNLVDLKSKQCFNKVKVFAQLGYVHVCLEDMILYKAPQYEHIIEHQKQVLQKEAITALNASLKLNKELNAIQGGIQPKTPETNMANIIAEDTQCVSSINFSTTNGQTLLEFNFLPNAIQRKQGKKKEKKLTNRLKLDKMSAKDQKQELAQAKNDQKSKISFAINLDIKEDDKLYKSEWSHLVLNKIAQNAKEGKGSKIVGYRLIARKKELASSANDGHEKYLYELQLSIKGAKLLNIGEYTSLYLNGFDFRYASDIEAWKKRCAGLDMSNTNCTVYVSDLSIANTNEFVHGSPYAYIWLDTPDGKIQYFPASSSVCNFMVESSKYSTIISEKQHQLSELEITIKADLEKLQTVNTPILNRFKKSISHPTARELKALESEFASLSKNIRKQHQITIDRLIKNLDLFIQYSSKYRGIQRKRGAYISSAVDHRSLNQILGMSGHIFIEDMNYAGAKKTAQATRIQLGSPASVQTRLNNKLLALGYDGLHVISNQYCFASQRSFDATKENKDDKDPIGTSRFHETSVGAIQRDFLAAYWLQFVHEPSDTRKDSSDYSIEDEAFDNVNKVNFLRTYLPSIFLINSTLAFSSFKLEEIYGFDIYSTFRASLSYYRNKWKKKLTPSGQSP